MIALENNNWIRLRKAISDLKSVKEEYFFKKKAIEAAKSAGKVGALQEIRDVFLKMITPNPEESTRINAVYVEKKKGYGEYLEVLNQNLINSHTLDKAIRYLPHAGHMVGFCSTGLNPYSFLIETILKPPVNENSRSGWWYNVFVRVVPREDDSVDLYVVIRKCISPANRDVSEAEKLPDLHPDSVEGIHSVSQYYNYMTSLFHIDAKDLYSNLL